MEKCFKFNINIQYLAMSLFALVVHDAPLCMHAHSGAFPRVMYSLTFFPGNFCQKELICFNQPILSFSITFSSGDLTSAWHKNLPAPAHSCDMSA